VLVASILVGTIKGLDLHYSEVTPIKRRQIEDARKQLEAEGENKQT
jgi:hypothetical protein